jgi:hypothetical protein
MRHFLPAPSPYHLLSNLQPLTVALNIGTEGFAYFGEIAKHSSLDILLYNIPQFTTELTLDVIEDLLVYGRIMGVLVGCEEMLLPSVMMCASGGPPRHVLDATEKNYLLKLEGQIGCILQDMGYQMTGHAPAQFYPVTTDHWAVSSDDLICAIFKGFGIHSEALLVFCGGITF